MSKYQIPPHFGHHSSQLAPRVISDFWYVVYKKTHALLLLLRRARAHVLQTALALILPGTWLLAGRSTIL